ncbi:hypothetical protein MLD38_019274 [Melastoma candidum]|uniref:Uncharacterized protein n=1 Tax=Melastoma candidum TaxID=119954 RepID=A0ACB9QWE8_9MYRT|nr:hypothetical protein MLD38_019274 [Melastoma candidum]
MRGKPMRGRQKIEMKPIENESDRLVTFSKRRAGIYRKANELVALCHVKLAIVIFSPSGKPFAFTSPLFESILHRFTGRNPSLEFLPNGLPSIDPEKETRRKEEFNELKALVESRKLRKKELGLKARERRGRGWWDKPINDLTMDGVYNQIHSYMELQKALDLVIAHHGSGASSSGGTCP